MCLKCPKKLSKAQSFILAFVKHNCILMIINTLEYKSISDSKLIVKVKTKVELRLIIHRVNKENNREFSKVKSFSSSPFLSVVSVLVKYKSYISYNSL